MRSSLPSCISARPKANPEDAVDLADHANYACLGQTRRLSDSRCVRSRLLFPEGPLFVDLPRPVSVSNSFCTSCHVDSNPSLTMSRTHALGGDLPLMPEDPRRQPMQHPPKFFGNILQFLFGTGPATDIDAPAPGEPLDVYTTPQSP